MFEKPKRITTDLGKTNRIVENTRIKGDINTEDDFRFDGELLGNFKSSGKLVIGIHGKIKGEIICKNIDIEGKFEGKIQVEETLSLKSTAVVLGEVNCEKLAVEPGAEFNGTCTMKGNVKNLISSNGERDEKGGKKKPSEELANAN